MAEPAKKPFDYERAKQLYASDSLSTGAQNELEHRITEHERQNRIVGGVAAFDESDFESAPEALSSKPEPVPAPAQVQTAGVAPAAPSVWDEFVATAAPMAKTVRRGAHDFFTGVGRSLTSEFADEAAAKLGTLGGESVPRMSGRGADARVLTEEEADDAAERELLGSIRDDQRMQEERSPWLTGAGRGVGYGLQAAAMSAATPYALGLRGAYLTPQVLAASGVMGGAATAGLEGAGRSEAEGMEKLQAGADAAQTGAMISMAVPSGARMVGEAVDQFGKPIAQAAGKLANRMRTAAPGGYGSDIKKLAAEEGLDFTEDRLGREIERLFPPRLMPRSARAYANEAKPMLDQARLTSGTLVDEATAAGATAPVKADIMEGIPAELREVGIFDTLAPIKEKAGKDVSLAGGQYAGQLGRQIDRLQNMIGEGTERLTPRQLQDMKIQLEAGYPKKAVANISDAATSRAMQDASKGPRAALDHAMSSDKLRPGLYEDWRQAKSDIGILSIVEELARNRAAQESGNQMMSLPTSIALAGGGATGAMVGGAEGGLIGVGSGIGSMVATEGVKRYGRDATANLLRGVEKTPRNIQAFTDWVQKPGPTTFAGSVGASMSAESQESRPKPHDLTRSVTYILNTQPNALGPYAAELQEAVDHGGSELGSVLQRLSKDPEFMRTVMPTLSAVRRGEQPTQ